MRLKQPSFTEAHSAGMEAYREGKPDLPPANLDRKHASTWKWGFSHAKVTTPRPMAEPAPESEGAPRQETIREMDTKAKKKRRNRTA